jgi:hypothetical protein
MPTALGPGFPDRGHSGADGKSKNAHKKSKLSEILPDRRQAILIFPTLDEVKPND